VAGRVVYGGQTNNLGSAELLWLAEHSCPTPSTSAFMSSPTYLPRLPAGSAGGSAPAAARRRHVGPAPAGPGSRHLWSPLHHYLRELRTAGLTVYRNDYKVTPDQVVALLVIIVAAPGPLRLATP
jgi:hypothetical protein